VMCRERTALAVVCCELRRPRVRSPAFECGTVTLRQSDDVRAHGEDERVGVKAFFQGGKYLYQLVRWLGRVRRCALTNFCPPPCTLTGMGNRTLLPDYACGLEEPR